MHIHRFLLLLSLAVPLALPAAAQTAKIGTVDLLRVFDGYWKTKQADANLKEEAAGLDKDRKPMLEQFQKAQDNYKKLLDGAGDATISSDERDKRKKAAEEQLVKIKELQNEIEQFNRQAQTMLFEKQRRVRDNLLTEIKEVVKAKAKAANYTYLFDTAAKSRDETPIVLYTNGDNDLTDEVLAQLNTNAPAGALKPATDSKAPEKPAKDEKK